MKHGEFSAAEKRIEMVFDKNLAVVYDKIEKRMMLADANNAYNASISGAGSISPMPQTTPEACIKRWKDAIENNSAIKNNIAGAINQWRNAAIHQIGKDKYDQMCLDAGADIAVLYVKGRFDEMLMDKLAKAGTPRNTAEYVIRKGLSESFWGVFQTDMQKDVFKRSESKYNPNAVERGVGTGMGMALDASVGGGSIGGFFSAMGVDLGLRGFEKYQEYKAKGVKSIPDFDVELSKRFFGSDKNEFIQIRANTKYCKEVKASSPTPKSKVKDGSDSVISIVNRFAATHKGYNKDAYDFNNVPVWVTDDVSKKVPDGNPKKLIATYESRAKYWSTQLQDMMNKKVDARYFSGKRLSINEVADRCLWYKSCANQVRMFSSVTNVPKWMRQQFHLDSGKVTIADIEKIHKLSSNYHAEAEDMKTRKQTSRVVFGKRMTLEQVENRAKEYDLAAFFATKTYQENQEAKALAAAKEQEAQAEQNAVYAQNTAFTQQGAMTTQSTGQNIAQSQPQMQQQTQNRNESGWDTVLNAFGLGDFSKVGNNWSYVLGMLPDTLLGMFSGKSNLKMGDAALPLGMLLLGMFVKNPILKMLLMVGGGASLFNKAGHAILTEGEEKEQRAVAVKQYPDEELNPRMKDLQMEGNRIVGRLDNVPFMLDIPEQTAACVRNGTLPLNYLANRIVERNNVSRTQGVQGYDYEQQQGQERSLTR